MPLEIKQAAAHAYPRGDYRSGAASDRAAQYALDPCQQFARFERLSDIVVRPGFQPDDAVHRVTRGSDHDDADPATALTQPARQRKPVFAGKPHVEHDKARQLAVDQVAQRRAVLYAVDPELMVGQVVDQHVALRYLVLDHYDMRSIVHPSGSLRCAPDAAPTLPAETRQRKSGWPKRGSGQGSRMRYRRLSGMHA